MKKRLLKETYATYVFFWLMATSRKTIGKNVFEMDWDVLILLDTCRVDALKEVAQEYNFLDNIEETWSVGSTSKEWVEQTFTQKYSDKIASTAYITGNPFSNTLLDEREQTEYGSTHGTWLDKANWANKFIKNNVVDANSLGHLEPLWGSTGPDAPFEDSQHPKPLTDYTIKASRSGDYNRVISHYMQPHSPYFASSNNYEELQEHEKAPFRVLKHGGKEDKKKVWDAYIDNLRYVLDHVETLVRNIDGTVVISADHGELLGDQRMYYHMPGNPHPKLKKVPWVEIEAEDEHTLTPDVSLSGYKTAEQASEQQLEALGYV